jgi:ADP-ribose pyrophosphatase YjhB (NUDIX family)
VRDCLQSDKTNTVKRPERDAFRVSGAIFAVFAGFEAPNGISRRSQALYPVGMTHANDEKFDPVRHTSSDHPGPVHRRVPIDDDRERLVCTDCGFINYVNPKIVVGSVAIWEGDKILLCRRAIEPRIGWWTLPAGYMEERETVIEGAMREAWEEARAEIEIDRLIGIYNIPRISQVQMIHRARLLSPDVSAGPESREVGLFTWDEIPWEEIAFPTVTWALHHWRETKHLDAFPPFYEPEQGL